MGRVVYLMGRTLAYWKTHGTRSTANRIYNYVAKSPTRSARRLESTSKGHPTPFGWDQSYVLQNAEGAINARRPRADVDYCLQVPFDAPRQSIRSKIAIVVHVFYVEVFESILIQLVKHVPFEFSLFVSTDDKKKKDAINEICCRYSIDVDCRICENRGRDIAPLLITFRDIYTRFDILLHLHTKKSLHSGGLAGWLDYLILSLVGSEEVVRSNINLLENHGVGFVFPQHLPNLRGSLNWGFDFDLAKSLVAKIGRRLSKDQVLEFPSGSMFWCRTAAMRLLVNQNFDVEDFPEERGQVDGTLAHAIERTFLHFCEASGFKWTKVYAGHSYPWPDAVLKWDPENPASVLNRICYPLLPELGKAAYPVARVYPELRPLTFAKDEDAHLRLNLLVPTINPRSIFGGISTALKVFIEISKQLPTAELRVVVTDDVIDNGAYENLVQVISKQQGAPPGSLKLVAAFERGSAAAEVGVRPADIFVSTAWWTEVLRREAESFRSQAFSGYERPGLYLIQDYESNFIPWGTRWALAESTYDLRPQDLSVVNSEELFNFMTNRFPLKDPYVLRYRPSFDAGPPSSLPRRKKIVAYARPSVPRNCFELLIDGLCLWQQRDPVTASEWEIVLAGETFPNDWCFPLQNFRVAGKMSLQEYGALLKEARVGVSLMLSPHPSYPPLEMASAGMTTITNDYDFKKMARRSENIISLSVLTPENLCQELAEAVSRSPSLPRAIQAVDCQGKNYDAGQIARQLLTEYDRRS